jgi:hypothetical protein
MIKLDFYYSNKQILNSKYLIFQFLLDIQNFYKIIIININENSNTIIIRTFMN